MKITSLELKGYKRLSLTSIEHFIYKPESKIQLILGSNGSGKSSLIKELSPLPANSTEYTKDGFKIITIEHRGFTYVLKSIFSSAGNKFHFIKDDEELNPGGTISVYRELVKKEFNITQDVHDLMIGTVCFHSMTVAERRTWFTRISDSDYTYAIAYYNRLREQLRDAQGAVKLMQSRLVQESEKLIKPEEEKAYREEIESFTQMLKSALDIRGASSLIKVDLESKLETTDDTISKLSREIIRYRSIFLNTENFSDIDQIEDNIISSMSEIKSLERHHEELCATIETQQKTLEALQKTNVTSLADLDRTISDLNNEVDELYKRIRLPIKIEDPKLAYQALLSVYTVLVEIFTTLTSNEDRAISRDTYVTALEYQKTLNIQLQTIEQQQQLLINRKKELEHFRDHNQVECPKCRHVWAKGYDLKSYQETIEAIGKNETLILDTKTKQAKHDNDIIRMKEYLELYRAYSNLCQTWPILNPLWSYISNNELVFKEPRQVIGCIEVLKEDLLLFIKINDILSSISENIKLKDILSKNQQSDTETLNKNVDALNRSLHRVQTDISKTRLQYSRYTLYRDTCYQVERCLKELESLLDGRKQNIDDLVSSIRRNSLNELITAIQLELTKREQLISRIDIQKALVQNLESQITELNEKIEVLKIAVKELSPSEGLIAKGLTGFINYFVNQINSFIKKIWLYPLELVPIAPNADEDLELDYKFSVKINDSIIIPDVSKASSAMKEVIDLAFRLVSMTYLNLSEAPLFLDEFAHSLDSSHRDSAFYVITNLMTSANFSQIFMISHYENSYGSLKNTDVTVLCPSNIVLPKDMAFNKVVTIN